MTTKTKTAVTTDNSNTAASKPTRTVQTQFRAVVLNRSGNVGKTTISRHLLAPRMDNFGDIIYIETSNADQETKNGKMLQSAHFERIANKMIQSVSSIVDVGSSNLEHTLELMRQIEGSHEDIDYIIIPTVKDPKQRADTVNTVHELVSMGIDPDKIKVVYNRVGLTDSVEEDFSELIFIMSKLGITHNPKAVIYENNFFPNFLNTGKLLDSLFVPTMQDNVDRKEDLRRMQMRTDAETKELRDLSKAITLQRNALSAINNLDDVYEVLFTV